VFAVNEDAATTGKRNPDSLAKCKRRVEIARALIAHGADVNVKDEYDVPLVVSADTDFMELLLDAGADVNAETRNGRSLLFCAIKASDMDMARRLLKRGAKCQEYGDDVPAIQVAEHYDDNSSEMVALLRR